MPEQATGTVPAPTAEQRRIAQESFAKSKELISDGGFDYAIQLLLTCCRLEPGNFHYRQELRRTQKTKYGNNLRGSRFAFLTTPRWKAKLKVAKRQPRVPEGARVRRTGAVPQPVGPGRPTGHGRGVRRARPVRPGRVHARPGAAEVPEGRDPQPRARAAVREARRLPEGDGALATGPREQPDRRGGGPQGQRPRRQRHHSEGAVRGGRGRHEGIAGHQPDRVPGGRAAGQAGPRGGADPQADRGRPDRGHAVPATRGRVPQEQPGRPRPRRTPARPRRDGQRVPDPTGTDEPRPRAAPQEPRTRRNAAPQTQGKGRAAREDEDDTPRSRRRRGNDRGGTGRAAPNWCARSTPARSTRSA